MRVKAEELRQGQMIRVEYGCQDNWIHFTVDRVSHFKHMVTVECHHGNIEASIGYAPYEPVEVMEESERTGKQENRRI